VTGAIRGVPAFREGKIERVDQWLRSLGHALRDFERSTFYSDSTNDLPASSRFSHPSPPTPPAARTHRARARLAGAELFE